LVIASKAGGDGRALLPHGIESIEDLPWDIARAIDHAHRVISWQENLSKEEQPPKWMWPHEDELTEWFKEVQLVRDEKYGTDSGGGDSREAPMEGMMGNSMADAKR
jgi:hypothetical protein